MSHAGKCSACSKSNLINIEENIACLGESRCCALYWAHCHAWYELHTMTYTIRNIEGDD